MSKMAWSATTSLGYPGLGDRKHTWFCFSFFFLFFLEYVSTAQVTLIRFVAKPFSGNLTINKGFWNSLLLRIPCKLIYSLNDFEQLLYPRYFYVLLNKTYKDYGPFGAFIFLLFITYVVVLLSFTPFNL